MTYSGKPIEDRFWNFVSKDGPCWLWTGFRNFYGYGLIRVSGKSNKMLRAHRVSWEIANGRVLGRAEIVCHKCDSPACVNPDHLFVGTHADNIKDKVSKGRQPRGETNGQAKLTEEEVLAIYGASGSCIEIATRFSVKHQTVSKIKMRKRWRHILPSGSNAYHVD